MDGQHQEMSNERAHLTWRLRTEARGTQSPFGVLIAATCPPSPATDTSDSGVRVLALMRVPWTQNARRAKCEARKASAYEKRSIDAQIVPQCRQGKCRQHVMSLDTFERHAGVPVEA